MKEKINIAELLKDCPNGMELDCTIYDNVKLIGVDEICITGFPIRVSRGDGYTMTLTKYGQYADADFGKCVIFPKGRTTWEGFVPPCKFKVGDRIKSIISQLVYTIKEVRENAYLVEEKTGCFFVPFYLERNYELVPNKFDINTLKPFDKVLVRCGNNAWHIQFFEKYDKRLNYPFVCMSNGSYNQCVPYKDNEYLLNTTDACSDFYKTWE